MLFANGRTGSLTVGESAIQIDSGVDYRLYSGLWVVADPSNTGQIYLVQNQT